MDLTLAVHVIGGVLGIVFGFVALYAAKGARLHRTSGMVFVYAMLTMTLVGAAMAIARNNAPQSNAPVGLLTAYLVMTALTTVRPPSPGQRRLDLGLMLVAAAMGLTLVAFGARTWISPNGRLNGMPALPYFLFGSVALLASYGDLRIVRAGSLRGAPRLRRHLWRMCTALLLAAVSFFLGPMRRIPEFMRIPALLPIPVWAVLLTMVYWLWRVRAKRPAHGVASEHAAEAA